MPERVRADMPKSPCEQPPASGRRFALGVVCALAGATLWGVSGACAQFLIDGYGVTPVFLTAARSAVAAVLFAALLAWKTRPTVRAVLRDPLALASFFVFGASLYLDQVTYTFSIEATNAGTATVLQALSTAFIVVVACLRAKRLPAPAETLGLMLALTATFLIATQGNPGVLVLPPAGLFWGLLNAAMVVVYVMYPRRLYARYGSVATIGCGMIAAAVFAGLAQAGAAALGGGAVGQASLDLVGVTVLVLGVGVLGTFVSFGLYLLGVSIVGSVKGGLLGAVEPASATVLAAVWLATPMSGFDWAGLALMTAMIVLTSLTKRQGASPTDTAASAG